MSTENRGGGEGGGADSTTNMAPVSGDETKWQRERSGGGSHQENSPLGHSAYSVDTNGMERLLEICGKGIKKPWKEIGEIKSSDLHPGASGAV